FPALATTAVKQIVTGGASRWVAVLLTNGTVRCFGPVLNCSPFAGFRFHNISGNTYFVCGIAMDLSIICTDQLNGGGGSQPIPTGQFQQVAPNAIHTCALRTNGSVACFGTLS